MASVALKGISKSFGTTRVLSGIDLDIADGEFLTLVGRLGLRQVDADPHHRRTRAAVRPARVEIGGRPIDHLRPHERRVAMVFQSYALYPHMSVADEHRAAADDAAARRCGSGCRWSSTCRRGGAA